MIEHHRKSLPEDRNAPAWMLDGWSRPALLIGAFGIVVLLLLALLGPRASADFPGTFNYIMRGWLSGFVLWTGASLGCMAFLMTSHLSAGKWGLSIRRILEAGAYATRSNCCPISSAVPSAME